MLNITPIQGRLYLVSILKDPLAEEGDDIAEFNQPIGLPVEATFDHDCGRAGREFHWFMLEDGTLYLVKPEHVWLPLNLVELASLALTAMSQVNVTVPFQKGPSVQRI